LGGKIDLECTGTYFLDSVRRENVQSTNDITLHNSILFSGRNDCLVTPSVRSKFTHVLYVSPTTLTVIMDHLISILTSLV
jgi:hypothetical protein